MANIHRSAKQAAKRLNFRFVAEIDSFSNEELKANNYYHGFPCLHNHTIRDRESHWCYHCVHKILSNRCGFDLNYLHTDYKFKYYKLWKQVNIADPEDCWIINTGNSCTPKRVCMPSYRSLYSHQKSENVSFHKALYQCAWGDVGALVVTRVCENPKCGNPLHMVSTWNQALPPNKVTPMEMEFQAQKLMLFSNNKDRSNLFQQGFKSVISNPIGAKESTE
jgi:hypothetical protein